MPIDALCAKQPALGVPSLLGGLGQEVVLGEPSQSPADRVSVGLKAFGEAGDALLAVEGCDVGPHLQARKLGWVHDQAYELAFVRSPARVRTTLEPEPVGANRHHLPPWCGAAVVALTGSGVLEYAGAAV